MVLELSPRRFMKRSVKHRSISTTKSLVRLMTESPNAFPISGPHGSSVPARRTGTSRCRKHWRGRERSKEPAVRVPHLRQRDAS